MKTFSLCDKDVSDVIDSDATSDFLLAPALEEIDNNESENIYERLRGKIIEHLKENSRRQSYGYANQTRKTFSKERC